MVEFFAQNMNGMLFSTNGWVQSFGSRCVRPPIFWNDISRTKAMTVREFTVAQSLTTKPVKGMLTGPVTILNWSFPRIDISRQTQAMQIGLAIRDEIADLEAAVSATELLSKWKNTILVKFVNNLIFYVLLILPCLGYDCRPS